MEMKPGHTRMQTLKKYHGSDRTKPEKIAFDEKLTFAKTTDIYHSGTIHDEDQPCHLHVLEPDLCTNRCVREYGNPCQHFCPAAVYEWVKKDEADVGKLQINFSNCVHCKTCDIMDPYDIIRWVPPEGGGGPAYQNL
jgi:electron-transferring-flavoprotein dehydrogenase